MSVLYNTVRERLFRAQDAAASEHKLNAPMLDIYGEGPMSWQEMFWYHRGQADALAAIATLMEAQP